MEERISNCQYDKKVNVCEPVPAEEKYAELTHLHEKFPFVPEDLEKHKSTETFNKIGEYFNSIHCHVETISIIDTHDFLRLMCLM